MTIVTDPGIRKRIMTERAIVRQFVRDAQLKGYAIEVDNGGGREPLQTEAHIMREAFACDDCRIYVVKDHKIRGWVYFVMGNDGWDVINDYSANEVTQLLIAGAEEVARKHEARG